MSEENAVVDAPVEAPPPEAPPAAPLDPEAVEAAALEQAAVELPEGDDVIKYVPLSAVTTARSEAKRAKDEARAIRAELDAAQAAAAAAQPYVDAARAILQNPQHQAPPEPQGMSPEDRAELEEEARDMDFYKTDGSLDLDRAQRSLNRTLKRADRIAEARVAPLQQQSAIAQARGVLEQAKGWKHPVSGETADPTILKAKWEQVARQPGGLATLKDPRAAAVVWNWALLESQVQRGHQPAPVARQPAPESPPVFVEPSGGGSNPIGLSSMEKKYAREAGMTEAEYLKAAKGAPRG